MKNKISKINMFAKVMILLVPLLLLNYLGYANFIEDHVFEYSYDIGGVDDNYLSPNDRISENLVENNETYRNLTGELVYFNIPIMEGSNVIDVSLRFKDNFPENGKFLLGARDQEEWHYDQEVIYRPTIESLIGKYSYEKEGDLILIKLNSKVPDYTINDFLVNPPQVKLATDQEIKISDFKIANYIPEDFTIDIALRETQNFYVYIKGDFEVEVEKLDLNWYDNKDVLEINLYDLDKNLIASETIKDDGENDKSADKDNTDDQEKTLFVPNLNEGVYRLELKNNGDMLITKIKLNQNKIILDKRAFLAQSGAYFNDFEKRSKIYFKSEDHVIISIKTYHSYAIDQTIKIDDVEIEIKKVNKDYTEYFSSSEIMHEITSRKNDIIITGPKFFSFSEESWFDPFSSGNVKFKEDKSYLEENADYVLVKYTPVKTDGEWRIVNLSFDLENTYINDKDELSMMLNVPHLNKDKNETNNMFISVDWIDIKVYKPGSFT